MNARAKTRNVDTIRNVLLDELVTELAMSYSDGGDVVHLNRALAENHPLVNALRRLQITIPRSHRVAGLTIQRAYWMERRPESDPMGDKAPGHHTEGLVAPPESASEASEGGSEG